MSIHPSLNISDKDKSTRSVLKRTERLKKLLDEGSWKEGNSIFGLPKVKTARIKAVKKEKAAATTEETTITEKTDTAAAVEKKTEKKPAKT